MNLDDLFPLELVSPRVKNTILREFQGRCPSIREMTQISDKQWLATPGIGSTCLENIRSVTNDQQPEAAIHSSIEIADAELLERLEFLQQELQGIRIALEYRAYGASSISSLAASAL
jgi:hypothetical protein